MGTHGKGAALLLLQHTNWLSAADFQSQPVLRNCCLRSARKKKSNWKDWSAQLNSGMQERCHPHLISRLPRQPHKMWAVVSKGFSGTALNCSQQPSNHRTTSQHWVAKAWSPEDKENLARWKKAPTCSDPSGSYPAKQQTPPCCPSARPSRSCLLHTHTAPRIFHPPAGGHICFLPLMTKCVLHWKWSATITRGMLLILTCLTI